MIYLALSTHVHQLYKGREVRRQGGLRKQGKEGGGERDVTGFQEDWIGNWMGKYVNLL